MSEPPPALIIELPLEGMPIAYHTAANDSEAGRLKDWLVSSQDPIKASVGSILDAVHLLREKPSEAR
jgi:hypothetical protein